ncbi:MAG: hypothetical protein WDM70_05975 [Nitrosomonadales bacterium]
MISQSGKSLRQRLCHMIVRQHHNRTAQIRKFMRVVPENMARDVIKENSRCRLRTTATG